MSKIIEIIKQPRVYLLSQLDQLSIAQLNHIPAGFNNNIIWNLGHLVAAQQGVCYLRAGIDMRIDPDFQALYKPGTRPEREFNEADVAQIKSLLLSTVDQLEADMSTGIFNNYVPWQTRYGVQIDTIQDAVAFLPFHEGLHLGVIGALRKLVG